jgi:hypothetical protein
MARKAALSSSLRVILVLHTVGYAALSFRLASAPRHSSYHSQRGVWTNPLDDTAPLQHAFMPLLPNQSGFN